MFDLFLFLLNQKFYETVHFDIYTGMFLLL